jgi:hypothetical protein
VFYILPMVHKLLLPRLADPAHEHAQPFARIACCNA